LEEDYKIGKICKEIKKLKKKTRKIGEKTYQIEEIAKLHLQKEDSKWNYTNPVLIILDAVLAINRNYLTFVKPRVMNFKKNYGDKIDSINKMLEFMNSMGLEKFSKNILQYDDPIRMQLLKKVLEEFKYYGEKNNFDDNDDDLSIMRKWSQSFDINDMKNDRIFNIKGIGLSTIQYLRMLLGIDTMMPDRHIKSWVMEALNIKKIGKKSYIRLLENTSNRLDLSCRDIVELIWALKNPRIPDLEDV
jgi:hypothetical protein